MFSYKCLEWRTPISNSSSGFLMSPYYPSFYLNDMERSWKLEVLGGQRIKLDFLFLNLEINEGDERDFLKIQDGNLFNRDVTVYSGTILPQQFVSKTNVLVVKFQSDIKNVHTGFKIRYQAVDGKNCGVIVVIQLYTLTSLLCAFSLAGDRDLLKDTHRWRQIHVRSRQQTCFSFFMPPKILQ